MHVYASTHSFWKDLLLNLHLAYLQILVWNVTNLIVEHELAEVAIWELVVQEV